MRSVPAHTRHSHFRSSLQPAPPALLDLPQWQSNQETLVDQTKSSKGDAMQNGSITRSTRSHGPDVWEFRWREAGSDGKRKHRRMVIGSIAQFSDKSSALLEVTALRRQINLHDPRLSLQPVTVSELVNHYRQRKLATDQTWKTYSTKVTYRGLPKQHGFCRAGKTMLFPQSMQARWSYGSDPCPWHGQPAPRSEIS